MGVKRKAEALFDPRCLDGPLSLNFSQPSSPPSTSMMSISQPQSSPPSLMSDSMSVSSMDTEPYNTAADTPSDYFDSNTTTHAPWLNMRTRKRVRDNRPTEREIHSSTLTKLFSAARAARRSDDSAMSLDDDEVMLPEIQMQYEDPGEVQVYDPDSDLSMGMASAPEANQRSLHDFFPRHKGKEKVMAPAAVSSPMLSSPPTRLDGSSLRDMAGTMGVLEAQTTQQLRERRSMGFLGGMNGAGRVGCGDEGPASMERGRSLPASGSRLPIDFRALSERRLVGVGAVESDVEMCGRDDEMAVD
jgi:hypothetical protein